MLNDRGGMRFEQKKQMINFSKMNLQNLTNYYLKKQNRRWQNYDILKMLST